METLAPEITPFDVVKIYEKNGMTISVEEAKQILDYMDNMIKLVKKQLLEHENRRFIYQGEHR